MATNLGNDNYWFRCKTVNGLEMTLLRFVDGDTEH
jgi:hypothetical protein